MDIEILHEDKHAPETEYKAELSNMMWPGWKTVRGWSITPSIKRNLPLKETFC
jgi:hypothetical protein